MEKWGKTDKGQGNQRHAARDSVEDDKGSKRRDEEWKLAGGGDVQVGGHYTPGNSGGGEAGAKERNIEESNSDRWGDDRSEA